jgi:hypothetical protein
VGPSLTVANSQLDFMTIDPQDGFGDLACWSRKKSCRLDIVTIWDFGIWAIITASVYEAGVF